MRVIFLIRVLSNLIILHVSTYNLSRAEDVENTPVYNVPKGKNINFTNSKAKDMCKKYAEHVYRKQESPLAFLNADVELVNECPIIEETLISGGTNASKNEFPHIAQIGFDIKGKAQPVWGCGGSLISERFILSAAHCTNPKDLGLVKWARLGILNTQSDSDRLAALVLRITASHNHPDYDPEEVYNDIALYKLERDVPLSHKIRPLCLDTEPSISAVAAVAIGWGDTKWKDNKGSDVLQKVTLNLVPNCRRIYGKEKGLSRGVVNEIMICAGNQKKKDACQGDSGGPLQINLETPYCMYSVVGVTSHGKGCGYGFPGIYTKVSYYIDWIEKIVWP